MRLANRRIRLLLFVFTLTLLGAFVRAFWLEGVRAASYDKMAATTVYADPKQITDPRRVAVAVAKALRLNPNTVYQAVSDRSRGFVYIERQAPQARAVKLQQEKLPGLGFYSEERRMYPQNQVGASFLGYVGVDDHGLAGLEVQLDKELSGRKGEQTIEAGETVVV